MSEPGTPRSRRSSKRSRADETSPPKGTPTKRGRSQEDAPSENGSTPSRRSSRSQQNGENGHAQNGGTPSVNGTPGRRSTKGKPASEAGTPCEFFSFFSFLFSLSFIDHHCLTHHIKSKYIYKIRSFTLQSYYIE